jgi:TolB-like protein
MRLRIPPSARQVMPRVLAVGLSVASALPASAQEDDRAVVAVLRYDNNTGDGQYDNLGRAFSTMMISDLSVIERIRLVERERLEELLGELELQQSAYVDPESAQSVGLIIGAQYVVAGAFVAVEPQMRLDTRVSRVETSEIVTTAEATGQRDSLFDLQQQLSAQVIEGMEVVLTEEEERRLREQQEANRIDDVDTMLKFSEALCLLDYGAYVEGLEAMQEVQRRAPGSAIVGSTLALLRERAEEEGRDRLRNEANRRIGRLLGRRSQPERPPRPAQCG